MRKFVIILSIFTFIGLDLSSKIYFEQILSLGKYIPILGDYLGLKFSYNTGIAFSLPLGGILLKVVTVGILTLILLHYLGIEYKKRLSVLDFGYVLLLAGAISHTYERLFYSQVRDFIFVKYFAILNFADIFISVGACIILFSYVYLSRNNK